MKKKIIIFALLSILMNYEKGYAFFCTNCSNWWTQIGEYALTGSQLAQQVSSYVQDAQNIVQQIMHYENMLQNTAKLTDIDTWRDNFVKFAELHNDLNLFMGDMNAASEVFSQHYKKDYSAMAQMQDFDSRQQAYQADADERQANLDDKLLNTFGLTSQGLRDYEESGQLRSHLNSLLDEPDGQMKALQTTNELTAIQIEEERKMRLLMTAQTQTIMEIEANKLAEERKNQALATEINKQTFLYNQREDVQVWN